MKGNFFLIISVNYLSTLNIACVEHVRFCYHFESIKIWTSMNAKLDASLY